MLKNNKQRKSFEQGRMRSQSQTLYENFDFEEEMKCNETLQELSYFTSNLQDSEGTCRCSKCEEFITNMQNQDMDADLKKRIKRREYKKRQKLKAQQKKEQALKDLSFIISEIYQLKTDYETEREKIQQCLKAIQKNVTRFYEFINAVIRQQVETIKKQMRICLMQLANSNPNFTKVPRLYEQFMKVKDASPQVQKIINQFIDIISQKTQQTTKYQRDLDKKTFKFLLISDFQNRNAFLQVIRIMEQGNIKYERQKEMLRMMIEMIRQKNISSECSSSEEGSEQQYSENQEQGEYEQQTQAIPEDMTRASERQYDSHQQCFDDESNLDYEEYEKQIREKRNVKRRRKNKGIRHYESSYQKTYETLLILEKTLSIKQEERLPCNVQEQWLDKIRAKYLTKSKEQPDQSKK